MKLINANNIIDCKTTMKLHEVTLFIQRILNYHILQIISKCLLAHEGILKLKINKQTKTDIDY